MIYSIDTLWGFEMKRYFLGLALALLAIPGFSRADLVLSRTTGNTAGTSTLNGAIFSISFTPTTLSRLDSLSLTVNNSTASAKDLELKFSFNSDLGSPFKFSSQSISNGGPFAYTYDLGTETNVDAPLKTLYFGFSSATGGATAADFSLGLRDTSAIGGSWNASASTSENFTFGLYATAVPEPTTMVLTGSVLAAGFGASMVRRFRKKTNIQDSVA